MTRPQLKDLLWTEYQEHAHTAWTKIEIQHRIQELDEYNGVTRPDRKMPKTSVQEAVRELRKAAKKKATLVEHCQNVLHMEVGPNSTIAQLEMAAMKRIYQSIPAEGQDLLGFGKNSQLMYVDMFKPEHQEYARWVTTTARENPDHGCDPRLYRLAAWLEEQKILTEKPKESATKARAKPSAMIPVTPKPKMSTASGSSEAAASSQNATEKKLQDQDRKIDMIASLLGEMRTELKEMKGDKMRKQSGKGYPTDTEMSEQSDASFYQINTPPKGE